MVDLVVLACVLRATTKKVVSFFVFPPPKYFLLEPPLPTCQVMMTFLVVGVMKTSNART